MPTSKLEEEIGRLAALPLSDLRQLWEKHFGKAPPRALRQAFLVRAIAHQIQVERLGDLSPALRKRLKDIAAALSSGSAAEVFQSPRIKPGSRLVRSHGGRVFSVVVLDD